MKCLCGFNQKPENLVPLLMHVDDCMSNGFLKNLDSEISIVWRNREFIATDEPKEDDRIMKVIPIPAGRTAMEKESLVPRVNARFGAVEETPKKKRAAKKKK